MTEYTIAKTKRYTRVTIKDKNKPKLSIRSNDSEKVVLKKVTKYATTSFINELFK